jgi:hypothetical protein
MTSYQIAFDVSRRDPSPKARGLSSRARQEHPIALRGAKRLMQRFSVGPNQALSREYQKVTSSPFIPLVFDNVRQPSNDIINNKAIQIFDSWR